MKSKTKGPKKHAKPAGSKVGATNVAPKKKPVAARIAKPKPAAKPGASKRTSLARPKAAVEPPPAKVDAPKAPQPDAAPVSSAPSVPGEAINGRHLERCIRYAALVSPKKDGELYFTHDEEGRPVISGHDLRRSHTGFLAEGAAMACDIAVPRDEAIELADALSGLTAPMVRIDETGRVTVNYGVAQPAHVHLLGNRTITQTWQPPSQEGRARATGPLRISASAQAAAVKWPDAVVHEHQSRDGIVWLNVSDAETGTLLARAVLAEDGRDLYAEDQRQTEIPGSRTAGAAGAARAGESVRKAVQALKEAIPEGTQLTIEAPGKPAVTLEGTGAVVIEAGGEQVVIASDAKVQTKPVDEAVVTPPRPAFPEEPGEKTVIEIPEALRDDLSPDTLEALHCPAQTRVSWFTGSDRTASTSLSAEDARAAGKLLAELGLICEDISAGRRYGLDVDVWTVGRAAPAKAVG